jgi:predicted enzyme related to lactoylglutathione lyase
MAYVSTPDVAASVQKAIGLGGNVIVPPFDVPTVGKLAVISDPLGAVIALLQPDTPMPAMAPGPGQFSWAELLTSDPEIALAFYSDMFGWEKVTDMDMGPAGMYHIFGRKGEQWGGIYRPPEAPGPSAWLYYAMVDSADAAAERATAAGGKLIHGPMEVPGGDRVAICMDPQGAMFALHSKAAS